MFHLEFYDRSSLRGSPYPIAKLKISSGYYPKKLLDGQISFQDKAAVSDDGQTAYVVYWDMVKGAPFFRVLKFSNLEKKTYQSQRIEGCCEEIRIIPETNSIKVKIFRHPNTLDETISDFREFFNGDTELPEKDPEKVLDQNLGSIPQEKLPSLITTLEQLIRENLLKEVKGGITLDLLQNHLDELLKSEMNDEIYFETQPHQIGYQLTVDNGNGLKIGFYKV